MAIHTDLPIYRTGVQLLSLAVKAQEQMPRGVKRSLGDKIAQHCVEMLDLMATAAPTPSTAARAAKKAGKLDQETKITIDGPIGQPSHEPLPESKPNGHGGSGLATDKGAAAGHLIAFGGNNTAGPVDVATACNAHGGAKGRPSPTLAKGAHPPAIAFSSKDHGADASADLAPTLRAMGHDGSHANGGGQMAVQTAMQVRRLTPRECERLQGFPEDYTRIPSWTGWRKLDVGEDPEQLRAEGLEVKQNKKTGRWRVKDVDGPRYKALGNSWAVPCARWIGARIDAALDTRCAKDKVTA